jgi:hypothetical protein
MDDIAWPKLSEFKQAATRVEALRKLRRLRQAYGNGASPPQRAVIELDCDLRPEAVILSTSTRSMLNKTLEHEEATITAELRSMGIEIDVDGPLWTSPRSSARSLKALAGNWLGDRQRGSWLRLWSARGCSRVTTYELRTAHRGRTGPPARRSSVAEAGSSARLSVDRRQRGSRFVSGRPDRGLKKTDRKTAGAPMSESYELYRALMEQRDDLSSIKDEELDHIRDRVKTDS